MAGKRIMGRPPARWMYSLLESKQLVGMEYLTYKELGDIFGVSVRSVESFCSKIKLKSEYAVVNGTVKRQIRVRALLKAAKEYLQTYDVR